MWAWDDDAEVLHIGRKTFGLGSLMGLGSVGTFAWNVGAFFLNVWIVMLVLGALHHGVSTVIPALGFWMVALVVLGIRAVISLAEVRR